MFTSLLTLHLVSAVFTQPCSRLFFTHSCNVSILLKVSLPSLLPFSLVPLPSFFSPVCPAR